MFKRFAALISLFVFSSAAFARPFTLETTGAEDVPQVQFPKPPAPAPVTPPGVTIAVYTTDEEFTFESEVKPALDARINALKAAGLTTLGGRVVPSGNDYSFAIDYVPTVKNGAALPPAVILDTYKNGAAYWRTQDAEAAMKACSANFRNAKVPVLGAYLYEEGSDNAFAVDFLQKSLLRPTQEYAVKFEKYTGGKYTFESEAQKAVPSWLALFKAAGVPAIRGKAVRREDGDYAVQVEYVTKTNSFGPRPQYAVARYESRDVFPFEKNALAAGQASLAVFSSAGVPPLSAVARKEGNDYSFSVDYLVGNIYQPGGTVPSAAIETYQAPETFTFDSEAKKALEAKKAEFNSAGLAVVGGAVSGSIGSYTYALDYIAKAGQPGPYLPPR
ncbi:MAG: hypothetical protein NDI60_09705 [Elusimicrobiales bacterium]|nr:hypothetical protein [Elusimicrobiales bacterium]